MRRTAVDDLAGRAVDELSGGQRQRVWLAMVLAQQTPLLLLDEPTTFLDIAHQLEVLDLCADLHEHHGHTVVTVLHDLNHACRYASHLIAMREGRIVAEGNPAEIVDADARRARLRPALARHPRPGDRAAPDRPGAPMTRPFPLHTGIADRDLGPPAHAAHDALHAARARVRRSRRRAAGRDPHARLGRPTPRSSCCRSSAGASRTASPSSTGATSPCARFDPARATIDVDFYLHGDLGRASAWGSRAQPGDVVGYAGPRTHWEPDPAAEWALLAADETGLPALLAILETLPAGLPVFAFAEVEDEGERQAVASAADVDLRWISRERRPAGTTSVLIDAVRALALPPGAAAGVGRRRGARHARRAPPPQGRAP